MTASSMVVPRDLLTAEYAVIYAWGLAGARMPASTRALARGALDAHRARRDLLRSRLLDAGADPPAAAAAYEISGTTATPADALDLAIRLEEDSARRYLAAVGSVSASARGLVVDALRDAAVRAARLRHLAESTAPATAATVAFPGR